MPHEPVAIEDAKVIAYKRRWAGVLVIAVGGGTFCGASYGMTRKKCDAMGKLLDRLCELMADGTVEIPETLQEK